MFAIASTSIDIAAESAKLASDKAGALVSFEGKVRNHNDGRAVEALEYEVYEALAVTEGLRIVAEAVRHFGLHGAAALHRSGRLAIGDVAVWVGVSASHRGEAFRACSYIIDELKTRLPIWKHEFYSDGTAEWVNCERCASHAHEHRHKVPA